MTDGLARLLERARLTTRDEEFSLEGKITLGKVSCQKRNTRYRSTKEYERANAFSFLLVFQLLLLIDFTNEP